MIARAEILAVALFLDTRAVDGWWTVAEVVAEMRRRGTRYAESTIRTHVTSRMCVNAPRNHAITYNDFERVGHRYRLYRGSGTRTPDR